MATLLRELTKWELVWYHGTVLTLLCGSYIQMRGCQFAMCSLGYFDETSKFRRRIIWFITSKLFDRLVLLLIFSNSVILAITDLSHVDASGDLGSTHWKRNTIVNHTDGISTTLFSIECTLDHRHEALR